MVCRSLEGEVEDVRGKRVHVQYEYNVLWCMAGCLNGSEQCEFLILLCHEHYLYVMMK